MNASDIIDGRYRLERLLGTGGMAEVWLAEDRRLRRWVAVKALRESFSEDADGDTIAAFEREATVIARLQHSGIVAVYDAGTHEGRRYIVMEYVHGYSLRHLLETQGRMTEPEVIRYGTQIAAALHYAHGRDVVHCDIKPENVLISETGVAKVADFGVAETLTRTMLPGQAQDLLGTVAYLAPEIIEGAAPSHASDTYSLGLTLFELVAGRPPFSGSAGASIGQRLATPAPLLRTYARGASPELEAVLARALALSPRDRFANAGAFGAALQRVPLTPATTGVRVVAGPPGRPPQLQQRNSTARVRRAPAPTPARGVSASTVFLAVGVVLAALGVGIAAAVLLSGVNDDDDPGGEPTAAVTNPATTTTVRTETRPAQAPTAAPSATPSPEASPSVSATANATATRTPSTTPTRTPTAGAATSTPPPTQASATPAVTRAPSPTP